MHTSPLLISAVFLPEAVVRYVIETGGFSSNEDDCRGIRTWGGGPEVPAFNNKGYPA